MTTKNHPNLRCTPCKDKDWINKMCCEANGDTTENLL